METTSLQIELVYSFSKFSSTGNVYLFFILMSSLMFPCHVIDMQGLEIRSIFGQFSQHLVDTVTFKCQWNIGWLSVVYNTMCFRVFLNVSSILETSSTGDQKCYGPWTLWYDNIDIHENASEKSTSHPLKHFCNYPDSCYLKEENFVWSWSKRGDRAQFRTVT